MMMIKISIVLLLCFTFIGCKDAPVCITCVEKNQSCTSTMECKEGYYCDNTLLKCTKYPLCKELKDCPDGLLCDRGLCIIKNAQLGDKCAESVICDGNLDCLNGICVLLDNKECTSDLECPFNKYCSVKQCVDRLTSGNQCNTTNQCTQGYICAKQAGETLATPGNPSPKPIYNCKRPFSYNLGDNCDPLIEDNPLSFGYQSICNISQGLVCDPVKKNCKVKTNLVPLNCSSCPSSDSCNCLEYPASSALPVCKDNFLMNTECSSAYQLLIDCANNGSFSIYYPSANFLKSCEEVICEYGYKCVTGNGDTHQTCHSKDIKFCPVKIVKLLNGTNTGTTTNGDTSTTSKPNIIDETTPSSSYLLIPSTSLILLFFTYIIMYS